VEALIGVYLTLTIFHLYRSLIDFIPATYINQSVRSTPQPIIAINYQTNQCWLVSTSPSYINIKLQSFFHPILMRFLTSARRKCSNLFLRIPQIKRCIQFSKLYWNSVSLKSFQTYFSEIFDQNNMRYFKCKNLRLLKVAPPNSCWSPAACYCSKSCPRVSNICNYIMF